MHAVGVSERDRGRTSSRIRHLDRYRGSGGGAGRRAVARRASPPIDARGAAPKAPAARARDCLFAWRGAVGIDLVPSATLLRVENGCIAARQQVKAPEDSPGMVEARAAWFAEGLEPRRIDEVRDPYLFDFIAVIVALAGIADFVGIKDGAVAGIDACGEIDARIDQHLNKLVACRNRPTAAQIPDRLHEDLGQRHSLVG